MKKITPLKFVSTFLLLFSLSFNCYSQIGIGTTSPKPEALLDIESEDGDKGILIPRVNILDLSTLEPIMTGTATESLLVYNTNTTTGPGFFYWNGADEWIAIGAGDVKDWYKENTTEAPTDINDNIYTQGYVGIGVNAPETTLHIVGSTVFNPTADVQLYANDFSSGSITSIPFNGGNNSCGFSSWSGGEWHISASAARIGNNTDNNCDINQEFYVGSFSPSKPSINISFDYNLTGNNFTFTAVLYNETTDTEEILLSLTAVASTTHTESRAAVAGNDYSLIFRYEKNSNGTGRSAIVDNINITEAGDPVLASSPFKLEDGMQAAGKILVSDANGYAYWDTAVNAVTGGGNSLTHAWYEEGETTAPDNILDNIYTYGKVFIGTETTMAAYPNDVLTVRALGNMFAINGYSEDAATAGVYGRSINGRGIWGESQNDYGIYSPDEGLAQDWDTFSDRRLKKQISSIDSTIVTKLLLLNPVNYYWDNENFPSLGNGTELKHGFIAQGLLEIFPELVSENAILDPNKSPSKDKISESDYKYHAVNYNGLIPILTKAIQVQQETIESQEERIAKLEKLVAQLLEDQ